jgi:hypothetical protein
MLNQQNPVLPVKNRRSSSQCEAPRLPVNGLQSNLRSDFEQGLLYHRRYLARFSLGWNHPSEKNSRQLINLEHVVIGKVCNFAATCSKPAKLEFARLTLYCSALKLFRVALYLSMKQLLNIFFRAEGTK